MANIVLVHGTNQHQQSADVLESVWIPALAGGVRNAGYTDCADSIWPRNGSSSLWSIRMAFFGDLYLNPDSQAAISSTPLDDQTGALIDSMVIETLERIRRSAPSSKDRHAAAHYFDVLANSKSASAQGAGKVARGAIRYLAKVPSVARIGMHIVERYLIQHFTHVTRFFQDESIRAQAKSRVQEQIDENTKIVIAHSLGTIVAYEVCCELSRPMPLFVTMGSPLGLRNVVYDLLRPHPPTFPPMVRQWLNVADPDDVIAAETDLTPMFSTGIPPGGSFVAHCEVDNEEQEHSAVRYLGKRIIGGTVARTLLSADRNIAHIEL